MTDIKDIKTEEEYEQISNALKEFLIQNRILLKVMNLNI